MNVRDFVLQRGPDEPVGDLADAYLKEVLALRDEDERMAALIPAVRQLVSTVASSLRKAQRGRAWPSGHAGGTHVGASADRSSQPDGDGPSEAWIAWLSDRRRAMYWVPGTGQKLMIDITDAEWERRAEWFENTARGLLTEAERCHNFAAFLRGHGATTAREFLT